MRQRMRQENERDLQNGGYQQPGQGDLNDQNHRNGRRSFEMDVLDGNSDSHDEDGFYPDSFEDDDQERRRGPRKNNPQQLNQNEAQLGLPPGFLNTQQGAPLMNNPNFNNSEPGAPPNPSFPDNTLQPQYQAPPGFPNPNQPINSQQGPPNATNQYEIGQPSPNPPSGFDNTPTINSTFFNSNIK